MQVLARWYIVVCTDKAKTRGSKIAWLGKKKCSREPLTIATLTVAGRTMPGEQLRAQFRRRYGGRWRVR